MNAQVPNVKTIFGKAMEIESPSERAQYLNEACADDPQLRNEVESLLRAAEQAPGFFEKLRPSAAATIDEQIAERPGTVIGPYKLLEQIGEGGFGVVFMAEQQEPIRRKVALKVIKPGMDTRQVIARFEAERQALALMDHPNIARVLDAGETPSARPFFVMELVRGVPITQYCDEVRMSPRERLELFTSVCQAIQHAHQKGIIHRDIKPNNVLVTQQDGKPLVKVIDFGIAKATGQQLTEKTLFTNFAQMIGTPLYMSPEQAGLSTQDVDTRSDIYSLGVLLYELLTGLTPFDKERMKKSAFEEIRRIIREEEPPRPSTRLTDSKDSLASISALRQTEPAKLTKLVRGELDWIVMKALEKDRNRRYETANGFAADVRRYLSDEPVQACPPSQTYRLKKFLRRNRGPALAAAAVLLALMGGIVGTTWGLVLAEWARQAATERAEGERQAKQEALVAAEAEKVAKETAQELEVETRAVLAFVENKVFAAARPQGQKGGLGRDVTLRQALEAALPFVDQSLTKQPLIEARLRRTLGNTFGQLGEAKIAAEQHDQARAIYAKHLGPYHPDTLTSMTALARSYAALGRYTDALKLREETLALQKTTLGPDHPDTLTSMNNLASSYQDVGRDADALKLREELLPLQKAKLGLDHANTLGSMVNLANSYHRFGRYADALKLYEETLLLMKAKIPDHPFRFNCMVGLANSYEVLGRHTDALKLREETLAVRKAKFGPDHPDTLRSMISLANSYDALGRPADALKLREETLTLQKTKLGLDHPDTLVTMYNLSFSYYNLGRHADALNLREETLALRKAKLGPDHPDTLKSMFNVVNSYLAVGRFADAVKLGEETLTLQKRKLRPDHPDTLKSMHNLASCYATIGRHADAVKLGKETLALEKARLGPDHPDTLASMWVLALSLFKLDRGVEAVPIIDECVQRAAGKVVHPRLIPGVMDNRLRHFEKTKDAAGCRATAEMWEKLKRTDAASLYDAACMRAVTAAVVKQDLKTPGADATRLAKEETDRAMAWLKQAMAAGYKDAAHMKEDKDLDPLRERPDFQKLLSELEKD